MNHYIVVASKDYVWVGLKQGIAQAGHGKRKNLNKLEKGDWVIYYSSKEKVDGKPFQKFTAIGQVQDEEAYQVSINDNFHPWRRRVQYYPSREISILPLIEKLDFIKIKKKWGFYLMNGFVRIGKTDFNLISGEILEANV